jgi:hypothetical protein
MEHQMRFLFATVAAAALALMTQSSSAEVFYRASPTTIQQAPATPVRVPLPVKLPVTPVPPPIVPQFLDIDADPIQFVQIPNVLGSEDVLSEIRRFKGAGAISVAISGTAVSYRLCQNSDCATGTVGSWTRGQSTAYDGQWVQLKVSPSTTPRVSYLWYAGNKNAPWWVGPIVQCLDMTICADGSILVTNSYWSDPILYPDVQRHFDGDLLYVTPTDAPYEMTFAEAVAYCEDLVFGGKSDWLLTDSSTTFTITPPGVLDAYGTTADEMYWINGPTNTYPTYLGMQSSVSSANFRTGVITNSDPTKTFRARCMRIAEK